MTTKEIAKKIVDTIKSDLMAEKKKYPNSNEFSTRIFLDGEDIHNTKIMIKKSWNKKLFTGISRSDAREVSRLVVAGLNDLKKTRGWGRLLWEMDGTCGVRNGWSTDYIDFPTEIRLMAEPCKEYKSLVNYLSKYCGKNLSETDIYSVAIGGKRGRVYGEEGDRYYLCHKPATCAKYLETLRKSRGSNDKVVSTAIKQEDDIDPWELQVSIRNEVEFSGARLKYFEVKISTPSGKEKAVIRIG